MATQDEIFFDYGGDDPRRSWLWIKNILKGRKPFPHPQDELEDPHQYAILGYMKFKGTSAFQKCRDEAVEFLDEGMRRKCISSYFIRGLVHLWEGDEQPGIKCLEFCAQENYSPALLTLGMAHMDQALSSSNHRVGRSYIWKAMDHNYLPARLYWQLKTTRSQRAGAKLSAALTLLRLKTLESWLKRVSPCDKRLSRFKDM